MCNLKIRKKKKKSMKSSRGRRSGLEVPGALVGKLSHVPLSLLVSRPSPESRRPRAPKSVPTGEALVSG